MGAMGARLGLVALTVAACGGTAGSGSLIPDTPTLASKCRVGASQTSVLVTEWNAAEKANMESQLGGGAIAVAFSGCDLRLLPNCRLPGQYGWQRTTLTSDRVEVKSDAELYTKLPLGAVSLDAELKKHGELAVTTTVAGQARLTGFQATMVPQDPSCAEATHLIDAVSVGTFVLSAGGNRSASGNLEAKVGGQVKGSMSQSATVLRSAGNAEACVNATDESPAMNCASPVQVFLAPIPGKAEPEGPPGTIRVDFVAADQDKRWDVVINDNAACTTPCASWVDPSRPLALRSREDVPQKLDVRRIPSGVGPVQVAAQARRDAMLSGGIVATTFGGLGVVTGATLLGVGAGVDSSGMKIGGGITLPAGAALTVFGIYLMLEARAKIEMRPLFGDGGPIISVTPAGIGGTF